MTLVSQAEYARHVGVSRPAIAQWKKAGRLVMQGSQVDVEASDALQKRYRRDGLPAALAPIEGVKRDRKSVKQSVKRQDLLNTERVCLTVAEITAQLAELDWKLDFDWSETAQAERARQAATCIGWEAVESPSRDDGHWGRFQLRMPMPGNSVMIEDHVAAGFGFELFPSDVLKECRSEVADDAGSDDDANEAEYLIRLDLLHHLARPFIECDSQK